MTSFHFFIIQYYILFLSISKAVFDNKILLIYTIIYYKKKGCYELKYEDALKYITGKKKFGEKNGLDGIRRLCDKMGNPQKELKFVHVAGTNGKGSTSVYIATVLEKAGYKTGLFTSPFIYEFNERIKINNENIKDDELVEILTEIKSVIDELEAEGFPAPTEFEVITAMAFLYFNKKKCDIVVLEVGLGGRFDSTNIIENPLVSVICSIGFDHMQYLGKTLGDIAFEKCGIIKEGRPVVNYPYQKKEARETVERIAIERNSELICCDADSIVIKKSDLRGNIFDACGIENAETKLCGVHQIYNASVAIMALKELVKQGYKIDNDIIKEGIKDTRWPARMETLSENPRLIFDGAHNSDGMEAFVNNVNELAKDKRKIIILGMVKDKDYGSCIEMVGAIADVLITTTLSNPRKEIADKLMEKASGTECEKYVTDNVGEALNKAFSLYRDDCIIFAVGSLYMANEIKMKIEIK